MFSDHAERRMEQRGVNELDVRGMLERSTALVPATTEGRFIVRASPQGRA
jgi:hypothetical protein